MFEQELATIKKPGEVDRVSKEEFENRILTIAHAKRDIVWWAENFFRIVSLNTGLGVIKLYEKQKDLLRHFVNNDRCITLASRQTGKTTTYTIFCMWLATLFSEKKIMICANKLQTAIEIMDRLRLSYEYLPSYLKPGILVYNKSEITFTNKSSIRAFSTSSSSSRGFSGQIVIIDEMAFIPKNIMDEFFASVIPVVSSAKDSKVIAVSTPNGTSGLYYDIWQLANSKDSLNNKEGWRPFRIDWWDVPGRTPEWRDKQIASIGKKRFDQEFGNEFISSTLVQKLVPEEVIERFRMKLSQYRLNGIKPKIQQIVSESQKEMFEFEMWHEFRSDRTYCATADISEGVGTDQSVLYVWDVTDLSRIKMCAKFASPRVSLVQFAYVINKILRAYGSPPLFMERNGVSAGTVDSLVTTYGYDNIPRENSKGVPGIYSHVSVKEKACAFAQEMFTTQGFGFEIYDKELVDEMSIFVKKDLKSAHRVYCAIPGPNSHDDCMMALIWLTYALDPERVDGYFQVCENFKTEFDKIYPKTLLPMNAYSPQLLKAVNDDPIYMDFVEFREKLTERQRQLYDGMREERGDVFAQNFRDPYFDDDGGPMWGSNPQENAPVNPNNRMPAFFLV